MRSLSKESRLLLLLLLLFYSAPAGADIGAHVGGHFGMGQMGNGAIGNDENRSMGTFDVQLMPGWRFLGKSLLAGILFDYRLIAQLANTTIDYSGQSMIFGLGLAYDFDLIKVLLTRDFKARHSYSGPDTVLNGNGWHLLAGYRLFPGTTFDVQFTTHSYKKKTTAGNQSDLTESPITHKNVAVGISFSY